MEASPLIIGFAAGFALFVLISMTSFLKLSIIFLIVRQALGMQQVPSNMIIMAMALFLSAFIARPVITESVANMTILVEDIETAADLLRLFEVGIAPFQSFMVANTDEINIRIMQSSASRLWEGSGIEPSQDDILIQVPAFMMSELTEAFQVGFLLFLPFIAIDLAITGILMALGMQMVQPNILSVPFKLLVFVFIDGWTNIFEGLLSSY